MKTALPTRPANIPEPPKGYVYLGKRADIKVPPSWDQLWPASRELLDYAVCDTSEPRTWRISLQTYGTNPNNHYAALPNTPLYNLNIKETPMPTAPVKTLEYKIVTRQNGLVAVQITKQSHRGKEFGQNGDCRFGKLGSSDYPAKEAIYWVRGSVANKDDDLILLNDAQFAEFEKEVAAYNSHFSKPAVLRTVFFEYAAGSVRGYRRVEVIREDETYLEGIDSKKKEYRKFLKSKIVGAVDTVKA